MTTHNSKQGCLFLFLEEELLNLYANNVKKDFRYNTSFTESVLVLSAFSRTLLNWQFHVLNWNVHNTRLQHRLPCLVDSGVITNHTLDLVTHNSYHQHMTY